MAEETYQQMLTRKKDQSIIISGVSGAGKTEATKLMLGYFANASDDMSQMNFDFNSLIHQVKDM